MGVTKVDFDYLDGKASAITLVTSSKDRELDESSLNAVNKAAMPAAPSTYAGKTLHMEVLFCYTINGINKCPDARNIIFVLGTRFISHGGDYVPVPSPDH